jgi:HEAT repeat protein
MSDHRIDDLLRPDGDAPVPIGLTARVLRIPDEHPHAPARRFVAAAAAVLLIAVVWTGWTRFATPPTTPPPIVRQAPVSIRERVMLALAVPLDESMVEEIGERALPSLHRAAVGEDAELAVAALGWIERLGHARSLPTLIDAADRPDRERAAAVALAAIGPRAMPALLPLLSRPGTSDVALAAVREIGGHRAVDALAAAIAVTGDRDVRRRLICALAEVDGVRGARRLLALFRDPRLGGDALTALLKSKEALRPALETLAAGRDLAAAKDALCALVLLADPASVPALTDLLDDRLRRPLAARALVRIDNREATEALLPFAADPSVLDACRFAGPGMEAFLLSRLATANAGRGPRLIRLLGLAGGDRSVPILVGKADHPATAPDAIAALGAIGTTRAVRALTALADDPHLRRMAVRALGESGTVAAVPTLVRIGREHRGLRREACRALTNIRSDLAAEGILLLERKEPIGRDSHRARAGSPRSVSLM